MEGNGTGKQESDQNLGDILGEIERFSRISSELKDCISEITRKIINSLDALKSVQQAVAAKRMELKDLFEMETSAAELKKLHEEQRLKQSEFEKVMENQRRLWEDEKALKEKEDEAYRQALKLRREREESDYRERLAREESAIRQKVEEELRLARQQTIEKQELLQQDLVERERALKEKELEWVRLIQELELFMTRLVERTRTKNAVGEVAAMNRNKNSVSPSGGMVAGTPAASIHDRDLEVESEAAVVLDDTTGPSVAAVRELLLSQERRIENIQADLNDSREPVPFRVRPKDNA